MKKRNMILGVILFLGLAIGNFVLLGNRPTSAEASDHVSPSPVFWTFAGAVPGGSSQLVRTNTGISAQLSTAELTPGQAMTLWFIVFNNPLECVSGPYDCGPADLGMNRAAKGDFVLATGHVIGDSGTATFAGHLNTGDVSGSGLPELPGGCVPGYDGCGGPVGLLNPEGALVVLAVHSHGPALTGQGLVSQIGSYLGGCEVVVGTVPGGFAASAGEVPDALGECATFQVSPHMP
jgi:hypothetical protein